MKKLTILICLYLPVFTHPLLSSGADSGGHHFGSGGGKFPSYFVGTFKDIVPEITGGTVPNTKISINCSRSGDCDFQIGENAAVSLKASANVPDLKYAKDALTYAKEHGSVPASSYLSWHANNLKPLLSSKSEIESCLDLTSDSLPEGYMLMCKLDRDPWNRKSILILGTQLSTCNELFCRFEIVPLFGK